MKKRKIRKVKRKVAKRKVTRCKPLKKKVTLRRRTITKKKPKTPLRRAVSVAVQKRLEPIGKITHYFPKVRVGVVKITKGALVLGDEIHIKGHTTDFKQRVNSIQLDHVPIEKAQAGQEVGVLVKSRVRQNDMVYKPC